jgi:hypothetical protein
MMMFPGNISLAVCHEEASTFTCVQLQLKITCQVVHRVSESTVRIILQEAQKRLSQLSCVPERGLRYNRRDNKVAYMRGRVEFSVAQLETRRARKLKLSHSMVRDHRSVIDHTQAVLHNTVMQFLPMRYSQKNRSPNKLPPFPTSSAKSIQFKSESKNYICAMISWTNLSTLQL